MKGEKTKPYAELLRRIERRRQARGDISEAKACGLAGLGKDCIRTIRRGNAPRAENLVKLARALECPRSYFLSAIGIDAGADLTDESVEDEEDAEIATGETLPPVPGYVPVRTLTTRPGMGGPSEAEPDSFGPPELLPERLIKVDLMGEPHHFLLMPVEGPSMSPVLESGDRILVDLRKKNPAQPWIFVVHDGLGYVAKWVEHIAHSDPPSVRISSENARFKSYDVTLDEARILGRVVWYARQF